VATSHPVRIVRSRPLPSADAAPGSEPEVPADGGPSKPPPERRVNHGGSQRALRVATIYVVLLLAMYLAFALYDRTSLGGSSSAAENGLIVLTALFALFAVVGAVYSLTPAPRAVDVAPDHVTIVGRWGRLRRLPPLANLSLRVVRRYSAGFLSSRRVELVEVWGEDIPIRSLLIEVGLFEGAASPRGL